MPILDNTYTQTAPESVYINKTKKETLADLRDDDEFVKRAERFIDSIDEGKNVADLYQFFRGTDWNFGDTTALGFKARNFTEEQKNDYNYLRTRWDNASVGGRGPERRQLIIDATQEIVTDPFNWASALLIPWTMGQSVTGRVATGEAAKLTIKEAVKKGVGQTIKTGVAKGASVIPGQTLKSPLTAKQTYGILSVEGMTWAGTNDYVHQSVDLATHRRDERDFMQTATVAATAGILAPATVGAIKGVTYTVPKFMKAVNEERIARIDNNENYKSSYPVKLTADVLDGAKKALYIGVLPVRPTTLFKDKSKKDKDLNTLLRIFRYDADEFFVAPKPGDQKLLELDYNAKLGKLWGNRQEELYSIIKKYKLREHHSLFNPIKGDKDLKTKVKRFLSSPTVKQVLSEETDLDLAYYLRTGFTTKFVDGKQVKLADNIIGAGQEIRKLLDNIYDDAVTLGLNPNKVINYFPRAWRIDKIKSNKDDFIKKIMKAEGSTFSSAEQLWKQLATEGSPESSSSVGLSGTRLQAERRLLKLKDKDFADYLSNDVENVLLKYIGETSALLTRTDLLGETVEDFSNKWLKKISDNNNIKLTKNEKDYLKLMYEITTGQRGRIDTSKTLIGFIPTGKIGGILHDTATVSMQTSMLGFSAITSLVEVGVPLLLGANYKLGKDAIVRAFNSSGQEFWNKQKANFGIGNPNKEVRPADRLDLNAFMNSVNLGAEDRITAIYGQAVSRPATKIQNVFFKTIGLHDLTRWLQLVGYDMGKNLIYKNLKTLVDNPNMNTTNRKLLQDQLAELNINVDEGIKWIKRGAEHTDDYYLSEVRAGANRYTNEVVMNPTAASNQKPLIHSLATTKWMYGLLGYITAFSNGPLRKVLRNLTKDTRSMVDGANPFAAGGNISTGRAITGAAFMYSIGLLNYTIRTGGRNYEDLNSGKISEEDFVKRTLAYSGLLGPAEMYMRYEFAERYENKIIAGIGSFTGPNVADIVEYLTQFSERGAVAEIVLKRSPFIVALKSTHPKIYQEALQEARRIDKEVLGLKGELPERPLESPLSPIKEKKYEGGIIRQQYFKGEKVSKDFPVTDVKETAADRVDPFTGSPYSDQMARLGLSNGGTALFEDRINNPSKYPYIRQDKELVTHRMYQQDNIAFPLVQLQPNGTLEDYGNDIEGARKAAIKNNNIKVFKTKEEAIAYANNGYKTKEFDEYYNNERVRLGLSEGGDPEGAVRLYDEDQGIRPVFPLLELLIGGPLRAAKIGKEVVQEVIEKRAMPKEVVHGSSEKGLKQIKSAAERSPKPNEGIQAGIYTSKKGGVAELYAKNGQLYTVDTSYIPKNAMNVFNLGKDKVLNTNKVPSSFYKILDDEIINAVPGRGKGSLKRFKENLVKGEGVTFVSPAIQDVLLKNNYKVINTNLVGGKNNNHYILLDNVVNVKGN